MTWWWVAFEDAAALKGQRARGAVIVAANDEIMAKHNARAVCRHPPWKCHVAQVDPKHGDPNPAWIERHLSNDDATHIATWWTGGVASESDIREAFSDERAQVGDLLFRRGGT